MTSKTLQTFDFEDKSIRVSLGENDNVYFVAADLARALGYRDAASMLRIVDDKEKGTRRVRTPGGDQMMLVVNESGFYRIALNREVHYVKGDEMKAFVRRFQEWVTSDVLPSIRKHGAYMTPDTIRQALTDPDTIIALATQLKEETAQREAAQAQVRALEPKARAYEDFCEAPDLSKIRDAAAILTTAGIPIRESELRTWMLDHGWIYRKGRGYRAYASHSEHLHLVPPNKTGRRHDGTEFTFDPIVHVTRRGLALLYRRLGEERVREQLHYDNQYPFDEEG